MRPRILVIRHRESTWNAERRWAGHADPNLSADGVIDAERVGAALAAPRFDAVVTSDLTRARRTGEIVASFQPPARLIEDPRLRELDAPPCEGLTREEIHARFPRFLERGPNGEQPDLPGVERWARFEQRVLAGLRDCATRGSRVLVVTHSGAMRVLRTALASPHGRVGRSTGVWLEWSGQGLVVAETQQLRRKRPR